jgi:hypothetical protein
MANIRKPTIRRGAGLLVLAVLLVGAFVMPATGHVTKSVPHLWTSHIRPRADVRYLQNTKVIVSATASVAALGNQSATVDCPAGLQATGGGVDFDDDTATVQVVTNAPTIAGGSIADATAGVNPKATGWEVSVVSLEALTAQTFVVGVICSK